MVSTFTVTEHSITGRVTAPTAGLRLPMPGKEHIMDGIKVPVSSNADVVRARLQGRSVAEAAGFHSTDLAVISTVISQMARAIARSNLPGEIAVSPFTETGKIGLRIVARTYLKGQSLDLTFVPRLRRFVDELEVTSEPGVTILTLKKWVDVWTE